MGYYYPFMEMKPWYSKWCKNRPYYVQVIIFISKINFTTTDLKSILLTFGFDDNQALMHLLNTIPHDSNWL